MSEFYLYNAAGDRIGVLQDEESIQWLEKYQSPGEVKICARATPQNLAILVEGNRIYNTDSDTVARISQIEISQDEGGDSITARANIDSAMLSDRVVMGTEIIRNVEAGMYALYSKNRRGLPMTLAAPVGYPEATDTEISWNSVLDAVMKLAQSSSLGFRVLFNPETAVETFQVYKGEERSKESLPSYTGYFGEDIGNIQNALIISGSNDFKNVAIVAGAGEGAKRTVLTVSLGSVSGENRKELYVDARDLQREYQVATPTGDYDSHGNPIFEYETRLYTDAEYFSILDARGRERLAEYLRDFSITCDIEQTNIQYGVDYFLGDRMPIKLPKYGIYASARISSANRIYEKEGTKIVALLSEFELEVR